MAPSELTGTRPSLSGVVRVGAGAVGSALLASPLVAGSLPLVRQAPSMVAAAGVATLMFAACADTRFRAAGAWASLAVLGQAAALHLVVAGTSVGYQHFHLPPEFGSAHVQVAAGVLLVQSLAVARVVARHAPAIRARLLEELDPWRLLLVGAAFVLTAATFSPSVPAYVSELAFAATVQAVNAATLVTAVSRLPEGAIDRARGWADSWLTRERTADSARMPLPFSAAVWVVGVTALLAFAVYQRHPHVPDEVVYLLQARYLAEGQLSLPVPPVPEAFNLDLMFLDRGRWYSPVPPGWPAVLSLGVLAGAPWMVNPLLAGACVLLVYRFLLDLYDPATARFGTLLLAVSPWFLFLSMSLMTHTALLTAALLGAAAMARLQESGDVRWAAVAGLGTGIVALIRPLDGLLLGLLLGCWALAIRGRSWRFAPAAVFALAAAGVASTVLLYNQYFTGDPTTFPIMEYTSEHYGAGSNALGFGPERGLGWGGFDPFPGHDLLDALINTNLNAFALNVELFGWSAGSLLPMLLLVASGRLRRTDLAMLGVVALVVAVYGLYWFSGGPDFGPRYWSLILVPCVALTSRAIPILGRLIGPRQSESEEDGPAERPPGRRARARGVFLVGLASFTAMATFLPWRAVDKYYHYRGMQPGVRALAAEQDFGEALVLVRGQRWPDYASAAVYNPLDLRASSPVYAWDRGPETRRELLSAYPGRDTWIVHGPSRTGSGYRVVGRLERKGRAR